MGELNDGCFLVDDECGDVVDDLVVEVWVNNSKLFVLWIVFFIEVCLDFFLKNWFFCFGLFKMLVDKFLDFLIKLGMLYVIFSWWLGGNGVLLFLDWKWYIDLVDLRFMLYWCVFLVIFIKVCFWLIDFLFVLWDICLVLSLFIFFIKLLDFFRIDLLGCFFVGFCLFFIFGFSIRFRGVFVLGNGN